MRPHACGPIADDVLGLEITTQFGVCDQPLLDTARRTAVAMAQGYLAPAHRSPRLPCAAAAVPAGGALARRQAREPLSAPDRAAAQAMIDLWTSSGSGEISAAAMMAREIDVFMDLLQRPGVEARLRAVIAAAGRRPRL